MAAGGTKAQNPVNISKFEKIMELLT